MTGLSPKERLRLNIAGDASQAFIRKAVDLAPRIEGYLPRGLDVDELRNDIDLMDALQPLEFAIAQLVEMLRDTRALLSAEAYSAALEIYRSAKQARGPEGIEDIVRELGRRFARPSRRAARVTSRPARRPNFRQTPHERVSIVSRRFWARGIRRRASSR